MSADRPRVVIDTGVFVSRLLRPDSVPAQAVRLSLTTGTVLVSDATASELFSVLARPKFASFMSPDEVQQAIETFVGAAEIVDVSAVITACRDPGDNKFLELAVSGTADVIVTGDDDLLCLHPFHSVAILTPRDFLTAHASKAVPIASAR